MHHCRDFILSNNNMRVRIDHPNRRDVLMTFAAGAGVTLLPRQAGANDSSTHSDGRQPQAGIVVPIGGALRFDHDAVWSRLVALSGGRGSKWVVFGLASTHPEAAAAQAASVLARHGANAAALLQGTQQSVTEWVTDPAAIGRLHGARGVFFCGGAQERIVDALQPEGVATPLLDSIREVQRRGGVIAGTSAGAAVMSTTMFRDAQDPFAVLQGQLRERREIDHGLGFAGPELFVDQHFLKRGRIGRMLPMMVARGYKLGLGVDENTAAIIEGNAVEVIGAKGALLVDLSGASSECQHGAFCLRGAKLSYLDRGDRFDLSTRRLAPSEQKRSDHPINPHAPGFEPYNAHARFWPDMLGDTAIVNAMSELIDSGDQESFGLAADLAAHPQAPHPELGFEFRLYKGEDSLGWFTGKFGGEDYSVANLYLDVTPVRLSRPFYAPWKG